jgi:hypothetical protein
MKHISLLVLALSALSAGESYAYTVRTYVFQEYAWSGPLTYSAPYFQVRMCQMVNGVPSNSCSSATTNYYGEAILSPTQSGYYMMYVWHNSYSFVTHSYFEDWGSSTVGSQVFVNAGLYDTYINWNSQPRPLPPDLIAPCNGCSIPASGTWLTWTDGLDADRRRATWPTTYDIYTSAAPPGHVGSAPETLSVADAPCNAGANGNCRFFAGPLEPMSGARYTWRIVAKMYTDEGVKDTSSVTYTVYQQ